MEEIKELGGACQFCPYYQTKANHDDANILVATYNYVLDPSIRKTLGLQLKNSIIIFDEGHNVTKAAEETLEFQIKLDDLDHVIKEVKQAFK